MPCRVKGEVYPLVGKLFSEANGLDLHIPQAVSNDRFGRFGAEIVFVSPSGVVGMAVGDEGPLDGLPWIDVHICRRAVDALVVKFK